MMRKFIHILVAVAILCMGIVQGCRQETGEAEYGYVQFRIVNSAMTKAGDSLDELGEAGKVRVIMTRNGHTITQTVPLNAASDASAEYGLRSDKLGLLAGDYVIESFSIYDKFDEVLAGVTVSETDYDGAFRIVPGGLEVKELGVNASTYGRIRFTLTKDLRAVLTKAADGAEYPFSSIRSVSIQLRNTFTGEETDRLKIDKIKVKTKTYYENGEQKTCAECDTLAKIPAGNYQVSKYFIYSDAAGKYGIEAGDLSDYNIPQFKVESFTTVDVEVPIRLSLSADYIQDYVALKAIWESLGGPSWSYYGEEYVNGSNWNFNKEIDLWGKQPGVNLNGSGRISSIDISGFGIKGDLPDEIGYLTDLQLLYLGTHNELVKGGNNASSVLSMTPEELKEHRLDYYHRVFEKDTRENMSDVLVKAINTDPRQRPVLKNDHRVMQKDISTGVETNGLRHISTAVKRLKNLQQLYIANCPIGEDGTFFKESQLFTSENLQWSDMTSFTDLEIYNCTKMTDAAFPIEMLEELPEITGLNLTSCTGVVNMQEMWRRINAGNSGGKVQILYFGHNHIEEFPDNVNLMAKIGILECTNCGIKRVKPLGSAINVAQVMLDYNEIEEIPAEAGSGLFCGLSMLESFSASHNKIREVPDIFNAKSVYEFASVDLSHNEMTKFANDAAHKGYNAKTIDFSYNAFTKFPSQLFKSGSPCEYFICAGNGLKKIEKGDLSGPKISRLMSIDLSYNRLKELPSSDFYSKNLPYLYGVELSYNAFDYFPTEVLDGKGVTVLALRHQRDDEGNRTLTYWPAGLYANCPSLQALYLASNDIRRVDDIVTNQIPILEIRDNPNITITLSSTACAYIQHDYMLFVYDKTQDIRGCPALLQ